METMEMEVFVYPKRLDDSWFNCHTDKSMNMNKPDMLKARLIIELPEKKIEITESEFDKIWIEASIETGFSHQYKTTIKEKIFK